MEDKKVLFLIEEIDRLKKALEKALTKNETRKKFMDKIRASNQKLNHRIHVLMNDIDTKDYNRGWNDHQRKGQHAFDDLHVEMYELRQIIETQLASIETKRELIDFLEDKIMESYE